ncbi:MAG: peptide chain release factor N(5)-glutamine methyltransferase [Clostridiales Family XIII bacterium]|jgi:release factor glutamine methyltransferase|nr:peptide chain release factor N(5)-glutamine methyltransferase [Clostridiales Family XIII bacterium]
MTLRVLLADAASRLRDAGVPDARHDAEALLCHAGGFSRESLFLNNNLPPDGQLAERYASYVGRRMRGEPLQYITGEAWFYGRRFAVGPGVLIPRPETETLAAAALSIADGGACRSALDLCTGSGALAVTLAAERPGLSVTATDISAEALAYARRNAEAHGAQARITFLEGDLFAALGSRPGAAFDLIASNPPYVRSGDLASLQREIREHEPAIALDGGAGGLAFYERIAGQAARYLNPRGALLLEIGADQGEGVRGILESRGFKGIQILHDLSEKPRVARAFL